MLFDKQKIQQFKVQYFNWNGFHQFYEVFIVETESNIATLWFYRFKLKTVFQFSNSREIFALNLETKFLTEHTNYYADIQTVCDTIFYSCAASTKYIDSNKNSFANIFVKIARLEAFHSFLFRFLVAKVKFTL